MFMFCDFCKLFAVIEIKIENFNIRILIFNNFKIEYLVAFALQNIKFYPEFFI